ncbi:MAG: ABC transporter ATP-binding protein [Lachnospiraceae bacterium]|nr:ABC transporter ATP-binding protein [Lachnospiraceae bacterium]
MSIIRCENLCRVFTLADGSRLQALKNVNIDIEEGKLTILKGRSGSGKTTLLNLLGGLDRPDSGKVFLDEREIQDLKGMERVRMRRENIGFVFQSVALIPTMNARENVEYSLRLAGIGKGRKERTLECLAAVGLSERETHFPEEMSGGEQQRVAVARAMAHKPKVIFADEPTGALDTATGLQVIKLLKDMIAKEHITVVMTTHDPGIMQFGDAGYELEDGEIIGKW